MSNHIYKEKLSCTRHSMMNCAVTLKMVKYVVYYSSNNNNSNNKELVWRHNHCSLKYLFKYLLSPFLLICGFFVCVFNQLFFYATDAKSPITWKKPHRCLL